MSLQNHATLTPAVQTTTQHDGPLPDDLLDKLQVQVTAWDLPYHRQQDALYLSRGPADAVIRVTLGRLDAHVTAPDALTLHQAREIVITLFDCIMPDISAALIWQSDAPKLHRPPNFHLARLRGTEMISANMLRVHMACDSVAALTTGGMHFSLLLPPDGRAPVWPQINDSNRTIWPSGADALHRASYTFVTLDPAAGQFSFDIYLHAGGRAGDWAQNAQPGAVIGLTGPGSGDFPVTQDLLIAGDETALPAIRRILAQASPTCRGRALIEVGDKAEITDLARPAGVTLEWVLRQDGNGLWPALSRIDRLSPDTFVWIAAEQAMIRQAKAHFATLGLTRDRSYICYYWTR
ncbi:MULTISPECIES: siderophore-interacting protein [unclassified Yoonia]|uniref:siderophore-interacting protein n=1 Tax=unclassified Yoonia TaxID=2629118 RepID=UPI002AFEAD01|nr:MULTISPECIES: siderophore-interacting protein [unclassified Yoonia]